MEAKVPICDELHPKPVDTPPERIRGVPTPVLRVHVDDTAGAELSTGLDALLAEGARRMLAAALEAEVDAYLSSLIHEVDEDGHRLVVRMALHTAEASDNGGNYSGNEVSRAA